MGQLYQKRCTRYRILKKDQIGLELIRTLNLTHQAGYVHGDIKPDNVIDKYNNEHSICSPYRFWISTPRWRNPAKLHSGILCS